MKTKIIPTIVKATVCSALLIALFTVPHSIVSGSQAKRSEIASADASNMSEADRTMEAQKQRLSADAADTSLMAVAPVKQAPAQKSRVTAPSGGPVIVTATAGTTGPTPYATLGAAFTAINAGTHQGDITVSIAASTAEGATPATLNGSGAGSAVYTSVLIRPTSDGVSVVGNPASGFGVIQLNGASNVTIDGDNPNSGGTNRDLTVQNNATSTTTFGQCVRIALAASGNNHADNDVIKNLNIVGNATGRNISSATSTTGSENTTYGILAGGGASTTAGAAPVAITSVSTVVGAGATANNLMIQNNSVVTAARGIAVQGSAATVFTGLLVENNVIGNITAGATDQVYSCGITVQGSGTAGSAIGTVRGNTIWVEGYVPTSSSAQGTGIALGAISATGTYTVEKNKVNRVRNNNGGTWPAYGINLGGGSNHVIQNNFVANVRNDQTAGTGGFGTTFGAYGIRVASGTGHKIYHNSVHLSGVLPGTVSTDLTVAFMIVATSQTGMDVRNNLFSNQLTGGNPTVNNTRHAVVFLPSGATSAMNLTWNNNGYYQGPSSAEPKDELAQVGTTAGSGEFYAANFDPSMTTPPSNLRAYTSTLSAAGTNDNASFAAATAPPVTSNVDLHIPAGTTTLLESGGAPVGVAVDIDMEARSATTPDIGADEFAGMAPPANDIAAIAVVFPANGSGVPNGSSIMPQASFKNVGTAAQSNITVQFTITGPGGYNYVNQQVIAAISPNQTVTVTFAATPAFSMTGTYNSTAAVTTPDSNPSNDMVSATFNVNNPLSGTITVGTGGDYTSLTNPGGAFDAINGLGLGSSLNIDIISDLTSETGVIPLNQWLEVVDQGGFTVTIRPRGGASPNGGVPRTISGTSSGGGLIKLNGADRVTIDGSIGGGGTDRSLTITNGNAGATVIWIASASASDGANNDTVKNCNISGNTGVVAVAGILSGSGTTLGNDAEAANNNITVQNNNIFRVQNSCYLRGSTGATDTGIVVTGNNFGSAVTADKNIFRGMLVGNTSGFVISRNTISGVQSTATSTAKMTGIQTALVVGSGTIEKNMIKDIKQINTGTYGAAGIDLTGGNNVLVRNNFISDINHDMSGGLAFSLTFGCFGIEIEAGTGHMVYGNSVNLFGLQTGTANSSLLTAAFALGATTDTGCDVRDNIFANNITGGTTSVAHVSVYLPSGGTSAMNLTENNNAYYYGTNASQQGVGQAGTTAGTNFFTTLAAFKAYSMTLSPSGTNDNMSLAFTSAVPFVSSTDLHLVCPAPVTDLGVAVAGLTDDIDSQPRDATTPDIGADEVTAPTAVSVVSHKVHGAAGPFDIPLPGVEDRTGGGTGDYELIFTFASPVTFSSAAVTSGVGSVFTSSGGGTNTVTVDLTGVTDVQCITVTLSCVNDGLNSGDVSASMTVLIGDSTGNGQNNAGDVSQVKQRVGQTVNSTNFRSDFNANGSINAGDVGIAKQKTGNAAGCAPQGRCYSTLTCIGPFVTTTCIDCLVTMGAGSWRDGGGMCHTTCPP